MPSDDNSDDSGDVIIMDQGKKKHRDMVIKSNLYPKNTISQLNEREIVTKY